MKSRSAQIAVICSLLLLAASCGSDDSDDADSPPGPEQTSTPEIVGDELVISVSGPFSASGVGPLYETWYDHSLVVWAEEVNDAGGINGRRITLRKVDNKGTPDGAIAACREIESNDSMLSLNMTGDEAETDCLDEAGRTSIHVTGHRESPGWEHSKSVNLQSAQGARSAEHVAGPLDWGSTAVGVIGVDSMSGSVMTDGFLERADELGVDVGDRAERVATGAASYLSELSRLRDSGTKTLVIFAALDVLTIMRDLDSMGWQPNVTGGWFTPDEISAAGADLLGGMHATRQWATSDSTAFADFEVLLRARRGEDVQVSTTEMGFYGTALLLEEVLTVAGEDLSQDSLDAALNSIDGFDAGGILPPISWSPDKDFGADGAFPIVCCNDDGTWQSEGSAVEQFPT